MQQSCRLETPFRKQILKRVRMVLQPDQLSLNLEDGDVQNPRCLFSIPCNMMQNKGHVRRLVLFETA